MGKKILVVDDSPTVRQQVKLALIQAGFEVVEAVDGVDGASQIGANKELSLVVCDVNMPRMNGIEMVASVKEHGYNVPIIMLTTEVDQNVMAKAKQLGVRGWMVKPFNPTNLIGAINKLTA